MNIPFSGSRLVRGSTDSAIQSAIVKDLKMMPSNRIPVLTPQGHLMLAPMDEARILPDNLRDRLESAFERGAGHGLLELEIREVGTALPADFAYWRDFAGRYVTILCTFAQPDGGASPAALSIIAVPPAETLAALASAAPPMPGGEYLNAEVLAALWEQIDAACRTERADARQTLQEFLKGRNPAWHLVGRVHFNLAENRSDEEAPFAFIATYTTRLSAQSRAQHLPLARRARGGDRCQAGEDARVHADAFAPHALRPIEGFREFLDRPLVKRRLRGRRTSAPAGVRLSLVHSGTAQTSARLARRADCLAFYSALGARDPGIHSGDHRQSRGSSDPEHIGGHRHRNDHFRNFFGVALLGQTVPGAAYR